MSTPDPDDDLLLDYVAAFREVERPAPEVEAKTWSDVQAATAAVAPARTRAPWVAIAVVAVAASLLLALLVDWRGLLSTTAEPEPTQAPFEATPDGEALPVVTPPDPKAHARRDPVPEIEPAPEVAPDPEPDPAPAPKEEATTPEPTKHRSKPKARPPSGPSTLAEETALLKSIQEALVQGQANLALGKVAAYRERFPKGVFRNEVTVAKAQALCKVGRPEQARAVADAFIERHPRSHLVARAKTICRP